MTPSGVACPRRTRSSETTGFLLLVPTKAVGITCTEVFGSIARCPTMTANLTRVRLDSLGPPQPP